jgi:cytochrome c oxidase subunit IV
MTAPASTPVLTGRPASRESVVAAPFLAWAALLALLALSVLAAHLPLAPGVKTAANLLAAAVSVGVITVVMMRLDRASNLVRLAAAAGAVWALFLFIMVAADYLSRP